MLDDRNDSDRRNLDGRRAGSDRRMAMVPVDIERRSSANRRSGFERRLGIDRRLAAYSYSHIL